MTSAVTKGQTRILNTRSDGGRVGTADGNIEDPVKYADHGSNESRLNENRWRGCGTQLPEDDIGPTTKDPVVGRTYNRQPQDTRLNG